jgi:hypothetical protein
MLQKAHGYCVWAFMWKIRETTQLMFARMKLFASAQFQSLLV